MSSRYLLDASAILALIGGEPGAERVRPLLPRASITGVNLAEVVKKLRERGVPLQVVEEVVSDLQIPVESGPADFRQAIQVGEIAALGRAFGLSMGDAVCLAVAGWSGRTVVTAERRWKDALPEADILTIR